MKPASDRHPASKRRPAFVEFVHQDLTDLRPFFGPTNEAVRGSTARLLCRTQASTQREPNSIAIMDLNGDDSQKCTSNVSR